MLLARNLASALGSVRVQLWILVVLRLHGPMTTREILAVAGQRTPLTENSLIKLLRKLRAVQTVRHWRLGRNFALWTISAAPRPERRQHQVPVTIDQRTPETQHGSWWVQPTREQFTTAARDRWTV